MNWVAPTASNRSSTAASLPPDILRRMLTFTPVLPKRVDHLFLQQVLATSALSSAQLEGDLAWLDLRQQVQEAMHARWQESLKANLEAQEKQQEITRAEEIIGWIGPASTLLLGALCCLTGVGLAFGVALLTVGGMTLGMSLANKYGGLQKLVEEIAPNDPAEQRKILIHIQLYAHLISTFLSLFSAFSLPGSTIVQVGMALVRGAEGIAGGSVRITASVRHKELLDSEAESKTRHAKVKVEIELLKIFRKQLKEHMEHGNNNAEFFKILMEIEKRLNQLWEVQA